MEHLPDSANYIAQLERKLDRIKQKNESKVTGKDLIASMSEFKEIYMRDAFKNNINLNSDSDANNETVDVSYLQRKIYPVQQINGEEVKCLVENDWLSNAQNDETNQQEKAKEPEINVIVMNELKE